MFFTDTLPFHLRLGLVKTIESIVQKPRFALRNVFLGEGEDISIKNQSYTIYRDRFLAPIPFEILSFFLMNSLTSGVGYLIRNLMSKFVSLSHVTKAAR